MKYFNLFSTLQIVKGAGRILVSDLQRNISELYPLEFYDIIEELKTHSIDDIISTYDKESKEIIQEYLDILLENEYGFITENDWDRNFPPLSYEYREPSIITDLFIEMTEVSILQNLQPSVEILGIKQLVIYSLIPLTVDDFTSIDKTFNSSVLSGIEIFSPFHQRVDQSFIQTLQKNTERIHSFVFYRCPQAPFKVKDEYTFTLQFVEEDLKISACGKVDMKHFNTNLPKILEAVHHNSCLHKKMGIDRNGNIKNCPLMPESFGNIQHHSLEEILDRNGFKKYWNLTKDHIEVCKDCEFRYICTDCRAYTEKTHHSKEGLDISKPLKCGYNPYTCTWEDWSISPLKQNIIQYYAL